MSETPTGLGSYITSLEAERDAAVRRAEQAEAKLAGMVPATDCVGLRDALNVRVEDLMHEMGRIIIERDTLRAKLDASERVRAAMRGILSEFRIASHVTTEDYARIQDCLCSERPTEPKPAK